MNKIILAGGCFWGVEAYFKRLKGVTDTEVGYTDGKGKHPTYQEVCDNSGHAEACLVSYDETVLPLVKVLEHFFRIVDPTELNRQGHDIGSQYRNAIYLFNLNDLNFVREYVNNLKSRYRAPVVTEVKLAGPFYNAEEYHQDYLDKVVGGYCHVNLHLAKQAELKEEYRDKISS